jgi:hypothetical protein
VDEKDAQKLATESGNSFQCRIANHFRAAGWTVLLSPYYLDLSTDKAREIDLIVEKSFPLRRLFRGPTQSLRLRLFIECKYIAQGVVFWFDSIDTARATEWIETNTVFTVTNTFIRQHHYLNLGSAVAKLFASQKQKGDENDPMFKALNQCLNGFIHNKPREMLIPPADDEETRQLSYPVIVCSDFGKFFRTHVEDDDAIAPVRLKDNFALEVNYAFVGPSGRPERRYFLIDVVEAAQLDTFLTALEDEVEAAKVLFGDN